ncbi:MAG: hypothetical protein MUE64_07070 [Ignavibacteriaceae bacterium]|jgi:hypothetical protein|nr:hypothetical protein [Ignavibacteriaceae bacterium]
MKKLYPKLMLGFLSLFFILTNVNAQENLKEKLNKIEGSVDKITITAAGKEYLFEGDEAEKLFKNLKRSSNHSFIWNTSDDKSGTKKVIILDADGESNEIEIESDDDNIVIVKTDGDFDDVSDGIQKKVKVEVEDGNKTVTVTTKEKGEEKTEVYEGKEAEEYIEKLKTENKDFDISIEKNKDAKTEKKIIIETNKDLE